jgi:hypothetical protein
MKTAKGSTLCKSGLPFVKSQHVDNTVVKIAATFKYSQVRGQGAVTRPTARSIPARDVALGWNRGALSAPESKLSKDKFTSLDT